MSMVRVSLVLLALAALWACGGEDREKNAAGPAPNEPAPADSPEESPMEPDAPKSPRDHGLQVGVIYRGALAAVVEEMRDRPEPAALRPELEKLKEEVIRELVAIGKVREAMPEADRAKMDSAIRSQLFGAPRDLFAEFSEGHKHYADIDRELGNLVASFNTITQYAAFELLKKQLPDEAKRLGIE